MNFARYIPILLLNVFNNVLSGFDSNSDHQIHFIKSLTLQQSSISGVCVELVSSTVKESKEVHRTRYTIMKTFAPGII